MLQTCEGSVIQFSYPQWPNKLAIIGIWLLILILNDPFCNSKVELCCSNFQIYPFYFLKLIASRNNLTLPLSLPETKEIIHKLQILSYRANKSHEILKFVSKKPSNNLDCSQCSFSKRHQTAVRCRWPLSRTIGTIKLATSKRLWCLFRCKQTSNWHET